MDGLPHHLHYQQGTSENSWTPVGPTTSETVIVVSSDESANVSAEEGNSKAGISELEIGKVSSEEQKVSVPKPDGHPTVADIKSSNDTLSSENWDGEKICRICLLSSDQSDNVSDTIQLGCACKDDLGFAHSHCAETWFRLKGDRCCEICGVAAKNIIGVGDNRFIEEWNESGFATSSNNNPSSRGGFWRGQPFCNFLMACLVIAFVLPWFLRINMF